MLDVKTRYARCLQLILHMLMSWGGAKEVLRCSRRQRINEHLVEVAQGRHHPPEQSGELMGATAPERGSTQVAR